MLLTERSKIVEIMLALEMGGIGNLLVLAMSRYGITAAYN